MNLEPYWWQAAPRLLDDPPAFPSPAKADVAIVGSGITGLVAGMDLARAGRSVVVFDAGEPGIGASSRNAGYVGRTFKYSFGELIEKHGVDYAKALYGELRHAFDTVRKVIGDEKIDCGFAMQGRYILAASPGQREFAQPGIRPESEASR